MSGITELIDVALEKARWRNLELRGIYLDPADYAAFALFETKRWQRETGSSATVVPLSYRNVLIIGGKALPVKEAKCSAVYATSGEAIYIPKRLSPRVKAA
jgi:hypothetical protein